MTFTYRVLLKPKDICFKTKLLPSSFDNGISLRETLQQLTNKEIFIEDVPTIDVVWCKEKWQWYTLNNRRLWVFRELEKNGKCQYITTKRVETIEHVTDFLLYGSAELIGESQAVSWDPDDGLKITVFNEANSADKQDRNPTKELAKENNKTECKDRDGNNNKQIQREWREMTPLTIRITWNSEKDKVENNAERRLVQSLKAPQNVKRERKDSGFSETSSGRSVDKSRACEVNSESQSDGENSIQESKSHTQRFSKFHRYRPYSRPESSDSSSESRENVLRKSRLRQSALQNLVHKRRGVYEHLLFILHHGDIPRKEQFSVKTKLMNTCGFCFKSFKVGVSLSQHVEELRHWACTRCGKYFNSYTALGQHKLSLELCNV